MYNRIFSNAWWFDRCIEGEMYFLPLVILLSLSILGSLALLLHKKNVAISKIIVITFIAVFPTVPLAGFIGLIMGFFVISCSYGYFWQGVRPAMEMYYKINHTRTYFNTVPHSEKELQALDGSSYAAVQRLTKNKYIYDIKTNSYVWYVRPSKYKMAIITPEGLVIKDVSEVDLPKGISE